MRPVDGRSIGLLILGKVTGQGRNQGDQWAERLERSGAVRRDQRPELVQSGSGCPEFAPSTLARSELAHPELDRPGLGRLELVRYRARQKAVTYRGSVGDSDGGRLGRGFLAFSYACVWTTGGMLRMTDST